MRLINTNLLNYFYKNGVKPLINQINAKFDKNKILNTPEEINANTHSDYCAGALAVKAINSNLSELRDNLTLDYKNAISNTDSTSYTANKRCRIYMEVFGNQSFYSYLVNNITLLQQNVYSEAGIPRGSFMCDLNTGDTFSIYIHSGAILLHRMVVIPYN